MNLTQKWDVVMEFAEMNYYKCKIEDEENAAFLDLHYSRAPFFELRLELTFRIRGASNLYFRTLWRSSHMHHHAASSTFDLQLHFRYTLLLLQFCGLAHFIDIFQQKPL